MATTQNYFPRKSESAPMIYAYEDKYDPQALFDKFSVGSI